MKQNFSLLQAEIIWIVKNKSIERNGLFLIRRKDIYMWLNKTVPTSDRNNVSKVITRMVKSGYLEQCSDCHMIYIKLSKTLDKLYDEIISER